MSAGLGPSSRADAVRRAHPAELVGRPDRGGGLGGPDGPEGGDDDRTESMLARAAWSRIIEPGDGVAGALVASVGASPALRWLTAVAGDRDSVRHGVARLCEHLEVSDAGARTRMERAVQRWQPRLVGLDPRRELSVLTRLGGRLVVPESDEWPRRLADLGSKAPMCLWVLGEASVAETLERSVALVGARASTDYGDRVAAELSLGLGDRGFTTVSGGAYGIDAAVHRGSLAGGLATVAFLAGGVDRLYPAGNSEMLRAIAAGEGLVLSEVPPGSVPSRVRFLNRNRLIAAAGAATVVVEAAWRSGSLATAARAVELLRPVGAVPGPVTSMASAGCHRLLREGRAVCVTDTQEVCELAGVIGDPGGQGHASEQAREDAARRPHDGLDPATTLVFDATPVRRSASVEAIVRAAGVSPGDALAGLGRLELLGLVVREGGGWRRTVS